MEQSTEKYFLEKIEAETNNEWEEIEELKKRGEIEKAERIRNKELSVYRIGKNIKSIKDSNISYIREKEINADTKKQLENKKQELEIEKKTILKNAIKWGFRVEDANEMIRDTEKEIRAIENQIEELSKSTDMEQFINRLPEVINETFELASKMLSSADIETMRDDIEQLLEICTFELTINEKKELKIKLFDGLEGWKISVVGDIGFEPMTLCV